MRRIIYISIFLIFLCCKREITEIRYYPTDFHTSIEYFEFINLDTTKLTLRQITNEIIHNGFDSDLGNIMIEFNDRAIKKRVIPYFYGSGLYKEENILKINSDSILIDNNYPISELKQILKRHYLNKNSNIRYSDSPEKAIIEVSIDSNENGNELKKLLVKLTRSFDEIKVEIKDKIELRVFLEYTNHPK